MNLVKYCTEAILWLYKSREGHGGGERETERERGEKKRNEQKSTRQKTHEERKPEAE